MWRPLHSNFYGGLGGSERAVTSGCRCPTLAAAHVALLFQVTRPSVPTPSCSRSCNHHFSTPTGVGHAGGEPRLIYPSNRAAHHGDTRATERAPVPRPCSLPLLIARCDRDAGRGARALAAGFARCSSPTPARPGHTLTDRWCSLVEPGLPKR